jgi:hypothetical protein
VLVDYCLRCSSNQEANPEIASGLNQGRSGKVGLP